MAFLSTLLKFQNFSKIGPSLRSLVTLNIAPQSDKSDNVKCHSGQMSHIRQLSTSNPMQSILRSGSGLSKKLLLPSSNSIISLPSHLLEETALSQLNAGYFVPARGMKIKTVLKRRCKDCYFIWIEGVKHNLCKTYGRHKQMRRPPYWANLRMMTDATQGPKRAW